MYPIFWFLIALIIGTTLLFIITTIIANKKLKHDIKPLWSLRKTLESFVRPNHRYSYQFDTYKHQFDETNLIDDKTYADLNLNALFDNMNFNFSAIGEMRLYA
ncbi:MutS family DNA mismatch repair protein, partial [bacterium M00.F.Ca.ET.162.01.1.1]